MRTTRKEMEYKGFFGSAHYCDEDEVFYGKVLDIRSLITYEGTDVKGLKEGFKEAVDDYLFSLGHGRNRHNSAQRQKIYAVVDTKTCSNCELKGRFWRMNFSKDVAKKFIESGIHEMGDVFSIVEFEVFDE